MKKPAQNKALSILIITLFLSLQVLLPLQASADVPLDYSPNKAGPFKISLSVIKTLAPQIIGCTGIVNKAAELIGKGQQVLSGAINSGISALGSALGIGGGGKDSYVPTNDKEVIAGQGAAATGLDCLGGIAIQLAKNQLNSITRDAMNWVNSGFNGDPMYVQDVNSFMNSLTDKILQKEVDLFKNPATSTDLPYGRDFARGAISAQQSAKNFAGSMKQDLTDYLVPGATPQSFADDFSQGGWDGWLALTQHTQNNPLGFTMKETEHIADLQTKTVQQKTDEINRNQGYLDQKKCILWQTVDANNQLQYNEDGTESTSSTGKPSDVCLKWATLTPGSTIKDKITNYINSPERQLELVKTLNDALNALFSNLLDKLSHQGLRGMSSVVNNYTSTNGGPGTNAVFDAFGNNLTPAGGGGNTGSAISSGDGFFDLTKDLGNTYTTGINIDKRGVLQLQQDYIDKSKKVIAMFPDILSSVGALDYCIPGPNPSWQSLVQSDPNAANMDPSELSTKISEYGAGVDAAYGSNSPMQDSSPGNTAYLPSSLVGLSITKDLPADASAIDQAQTAYKTMIATTAGNLTKLNDIKDKVNRIIQAAQSRRAAARRAAGLPAMKASCLEAERVTYVVNGTKV